MKALYYGDNLQVLRDSIATECVDLIYLDPPFNSKATYNVGCKGQGGRNRMRGRTAACSQEMSLHEKPRIHTSWPRSAQMGCSHLLPYLWERYFKDRTPT